MLIESLGFSLIIGKIRGGKIRSIGEVRIKGWYLFVLVFAIEYISILIELFTEGKMTQFIQNNFSYIHIGSYVIILIGLILNINKKEIIPIFIGSLLNFISILFNGGKMPAEILKSNNVLTHTLINETTKCYYLSDIISIQQLYPFPKLISIGDIIIAIGIFLLIQKAMLNKRKKGKVLDFTYKPNL